MADIDKQLPAVINQTTVAVSKLEPKLEAVYNQLVAIGQVNTNFTKVNNVMKTTSVQSSKVVSKVNNISLTMNSGGKAAKSYGNALKSLSSVFSYIEAAAKKIWSAMESTADYMKVYNSYKDTFGDIASEWSADYEKYGYENAEVYAESYTNRMNETFAKLSGIKFDSENMQIASNDVKNLGLSLEDVTKCATDLANVTNSIGFSGEESLASADAFTKLAGDLAAKYDVDYSTVGQALAKGIAGQSEELGNYEIDISEANLQNYAGDLGIDESVADMSQAEQMQLRMIAILDQSKQAWGNLAVAMEQPSVQISMLKSNFTELIQTLGQLFMPLLQKILPFINGVTIAIKTLLGNIAKILGIDMQSSAQETSDVAQEFTNVSESAEEAGDSVKKAKTHLLGIDELNVVESEAGTDTSKDTKNSGVELSTNLSSMLGDYESMWEKAYADMENKAQEFADKLSVVFKPIEQLFYDIKIGDWFAVGEDTSNIVNGIFNLFSDGIANVDWYTLGNNIGLFFAGIDWSSIFSSLGRLIWEGISSSIEMWVGSFNIAPFETAFLTVLALPGIVGFGSKLVELITTPFKQAFDLLPFSSQITEMFTLWTGGAGTLGESFMAVFGTSGIIAIALAGLVVGLKWVYDKNEEVRSSFEQVTESISKGFQPLMELITNDIIPDLQSGWDLLIKTIYPFTEFLESIFVSIWIEMINPALTYLGETILPLLTTTLDMLWNDVFVPFGEFISSFFMPIIEWLSAGLMVLWENIVVPLADAVANILGKAFEGIVGIINVLFIPIIDVVIDIFQILWTEILEPVSTWLVDTFGPVFETVFVIIGNLIDNLSQTFGGLLDFIFGVFTLDWKKAWEGIKDVFKGVFNTILSVFEGAANLIIDGINIILSTINLITGEVGDVLGINLTIPLMQHFEVQRFAVGGFPEDGLFMANHGELVGKFSNGKTAVANNEQIVSGIKLGVQEAVSEVLAPYLADIAQNTRETANKDLSVNIGDREIARANRRGQKSLGFQLITE